MERYENNPIITRKHIPDSQAHLKDVTSVFNPGAVRQLMQKCRRVDGRGMSNTDNMKLVSVLSTTLLHHHYIENDGGVGRDNRPPGPMTIIDMVNGIRNEQK